MKLLLLLELLLYGLLYYYNRMAYTYYYYRMAYQGIIEWLFRAYQGKWNGFYIRAFILFIRAYQGSYIMYYYNIMAYQGSHSINIYITILLLFY